MLFINEEKCNKHLDELKRFRGFLPLQFDTVVSLAFREKFLKSIGLWEEANNKRIEVMKGIRDTYPDEDIYLELILKEWLIENPQFKECFNVVT